MKLQVKKRFGWGSKQLAPGDLLSGDAADFVWAHPLMKTNVQPLPASVKDDHHAPAITAVPPELLALAPKSAQAKNPIAASLAAPVNAIKDAAQAVAAAVLPSKEL